jgi:RND superfamily putative drug exporter
VAGRFAAVVVRLRVLIVVAWLGAAVACALLLPGLEEAQTGALGDLVPAGAEAIEAEERSAALFAFPLASRTVVVERDPGGLSPARLARTAMRVAQVNRGTLGPLRDAAGAYGLTNAIGGLAFARERGTTALSYLLFPLDIGQVGRSQRAENFVEALGPPAPGSTVGVTGAVPARAAQADAIDERLPLIELVTVLLVTVIVAVHLRSAVAPLVTLVTVAVAYLVSVRVIAVLGQALGVSVPSEVEPVLVALLFGVVTDYALFYMSRLRGRLLASDDAADAARRTVAELTPIVLACGLSVVAGAGVLAVAQLGFLRAFGPAMAMAVAVGLLVALTLLPALLALLGRALFWPRPPKRAAADADADRDAGAGAGAPAPFADRLVQAVVRRPRRATAACLAVLGLLTAPIAFLELGNPLIRGLAPGSEPRQAYTALSEGFAPGVVAPATLVVEAPGITARREELATLQAVLVNQPGVAGVLGPADLPGAAAEPLGAVLSRTGNAARFVLISEDDPFGADAVRLLGNLRARIGGLLEGSGLPDARASLAGDTALVAETIELANGDLLRIAPLVLLAVALVLAVFLRALVAPAYLVLLAALSPLAALGLAVALFQGLLGYGELTYFVPVVAGVLLVALGSDYNVFLVGRIWTEARHRPLREAIVTGAAGASRAISAAGIVLAASFAALALVPVRSFQELAFVLAAGLLIDTFIVRTVLAPAVIALVGRRSGWPGDALAQRAGGAVVAHPRPPADAGRAPAGLPGDLPA